MKTAERYTLHENLLIIGGLLLAVTLVILGAVLSRHHVGLRLIPKSRASLEIFYFQNLLPGDGKFTAIVPGSPELHDVSLRLSEGYPGQAREILIALQKRVNDNRLLVAVYNDLGNLAEDRREFPTAFRYYQQALSLAPKNSHVLFNMGIAAYHKGDPKASLRHFSDSWRYDHGLEQSPMNAGNICFEMKDFPQAESFYRSIPPRSPLYSQARYNLAQALLAADYQHNQKEASDLLKSLSSRNDDIAYFAALSLGNISYSSGDMGHAEEYYRNACTINTQNYIAYYNLAMVDKESGNSQDAIKNFQKALENRKGFGSALLHMGEIYYDRSELQQGIASLEQFVSSTNDPTARSLLADLLYQNASFAEAFEIYSDLSKTATGPERKTALNNMGNIFFRLGNYQRALDNYREASAQDSDEPAEYHNLGAVFARMKDYQESMRNFQRCLALDPGNKDARWNVIVLYMRLGYPDKAIQKCREYLASSPDDQGLRYLLAYLLYVRKDFSGAADELANIKGSEREIVCAVELLGGIIDDSLGRHDEASRHYDKVLSLDKTNLQALFNSGISRYQATDYDKAIGCFQKSLVRSQDKEKTGAIWMNIGNSYYRKKEYTMAMDAYDKAFGYIPDSNELRLNMAVVRKRLDSRNRKPEL